MPKSFLYQIVIKISCQGPCMAAHEITLPDEVVPTELSVRNTLQEKGWEFRPKGPICEFCCAREQAVGKLRPSSRKVFAGRFD